MKTTLGLIGLFCITLIFGCVKKEVSNIPAETAATEGVGSVLVISEVAGMVMIDGAETGTQIKSNGTATINNILNGDTEVAVKLGDGTTIQAVDTVLVKSGETITVRISAPVEKRERAEAPIVPEMPPEIAEAPVTPKAAPPAEPVRQSQAVDKRPAPKPAVEPVRQNQPATQPETQRQRNSTDNAQSVERLIVAANQHLDRKEYDEAIAAYSEILRLDSNHAGAYLNRGSAYSRKGEYDRAIEDYNEALRINPNYADAYNNRGNAYFNKGDWDRAIADYDQAVRINPNYAVAYNNRGRAYHKKWEYDKAIADYDQAVQINPNYADAYYNRGLAYFFDKLDVDRAIADWERVLQINPNHAGARSNLEGLRQRGY